jgi:cytochrome c(L)
MRSGFMPRAATVLASVAAAASLLGQPAATRAQGDGAAKKRNPFTGNADAIKEGRALYLQHGCSGCHGVQGGGGMAMPLLDDTWEFGSSDDVLFRLIKGEIAESTMPKVWQLESDQVWKVIAYVRSLYRGDPSKVDW